ncbi:hypothetical protein CX680_31335 [Klebsiella pneumoniae]|nr:hypothetical protein CX680_31335 [Klebsiella pneumoniae]
MTVGRFPIPELAWGARRHLILPPGGGNNSRGSAELLPFLYDGGPLSDPGARLGRQTTPDSAAGRRQ